MIKLKFTDSSRDLSSHERLRSGRLPLSYMLPWHSLGCRTFIEVLKGAKLAYPNIDRSLLCDVSAEQNRHIAAVSMLLFEKNETPHVLVLKKKVRAVASCRPLNVCLVRLG